MIELSDADNLEKAFALAIEKASNEMDLSPVRPIPQKIVLEDFPILNGYRAGVLASKDKLILSSRLNVKRLRSVIAREAFNLLIPENLDRLRVIYDLAWAYSGAELSWWKECSQVIWDPRFPLYNAPEVLSPLPRKRLVMVLRRMLHLLRGLNDVGRRVTLEEYLSIFSEAAGLLEPVRLSKVQIKVIEELARSPYLTQGELARKLGFSKSAVSKALSKLTALGILSGPENVVLERIGLAGLLAIVPDSPIMEKAFAKFPFTYRILRPISRALPSFIILIFPNEGLTSLRLVLNSGRTKLARMLRLTFTHKTTPFNPDSDVEKALRLLSEGIEFKIRGEREVVVPKLNRHDLMIVNRVLRKGRVSVSVVRAMGIPSAESRLRRLRELGVLRKFYTVGGYRLGRPISVMINSKQEDFPRISAALGAMSTSLSVYVEGDFSGVWGLLLTSDRDVLKLIQSLRLIFGNQLENAAPLLDFSPSYWSIPIDLWDERDNRFRYEAALEELASQISPYHPGDAGRPPGDQRPDEVD